MKGKTPVNVGASVRARLLKVSKERHEDFTLILMNYAAERFLYRLSRSSRREQFVLKGAMLFAVRIGELYRPTRDLDLLSVGEHSEAAIEAAIRDIVVTPADDDGVSFDLGTLQVHPIREDNRYGGIRAIMEAQLTEARIHVQIDVGFGDAITPAALDLDFPTLLANMPAPNVLAYPTETIVAEKVEAMVELGRAAETRNGHCAGCSPSSATSISFKSACGRANRSSRMRSIVGNEWRSHTPPASRASGTA
jgi:predicted nucleotidyltransferase component of viral defense system